MAAEREVSWQSALRVENEWVCGKVTLTLDAPSAQQQGCQRIRCSNQPK
jgi:hypothetical protein